MAMQVGESGGEAEETPMSDINTTPLVDVMLVLLIIFLITVPVVLQTVPVRLPKVEFEVTVTKPENVNLTVRASDSGECEVYWDLTRMNSEDLLNRAVTTLEDQIAGVGPRTHIDVDLTALLARPRRRIDQDAVRSVIQGKRIAITGAGGSIGSELCRQIIKLRPSQMILYDNSEYGLYLIESELREMQRVLEPPATPLVGDGPPSNPTLEVIERAYIMWVLSVEGGNKARAAEVLGIDPSTLYRKLNRYGVTES